MALKEVCIAARTFGPSRAQAGDIIAIREPRGVVGTREQHDFIWLLADDSELPSPDNLRGEQQKFKWQIPLPSLSLNLSRAFDPTDRYQPFITLSNEGIILDSIPQSALTINNKEAR